jgi:hypothetical protein
MSRYINSGVYVYDDAADEWTKHDTPELAKAYAAENDPHEMVEVEVAAPTSIATKLVIVANGLGAFAKTGALMLVPMNPARKRLLISTYATANPADQSTGVIIGSREQVMAQSGYFLQTPSQTVLENSAEIWVDCAPSPWIAANGNTTLVTALSEIEG